MNKSNTIEWVFKIIQKKEIAFNIPSNDINKYPVFEHYSYELKEVFVLYIFHPVASTNLEQYKEYIIRMYKRKYRAYKVEFLEPIKKLGY